MQHPPATSRGPQRIDAVFCAATTEIALGLAKRALGADALVLSTRTLETSEGSRVELIASNGIGARDESPLRGLGARMLGTEPAPARSLSQLERLLRQHDVPHTLARDLVMRIGDPEGTRHELPELLLRLLRSTVGFGDGSRSGHRAIALVGPTGVGKTTTIAKLAAREALLARRSVGLISLDDYRIGGAEQLARYAELIEVPFEVARDEASFRRAMERFRGLDRVFIDTAGRSPRDASPLFSHRIGELAAGMGMPLGVGLTLAAGTRTAELEHALSGYGAPRPHFLVLTKLDEAVLGGAALVATAQAMLPLAWTTDGQRVPEDIEVATAERIAGLLLGSAVGGRS